MLSCRMRNVPSYIHDGRERDLPMLPFGVLSVWEIAPQYSPFRGSAFLISFPELGMVRDGGGCG